MQIGTRSRTDEKDLLAVGLDIAKHTHWARTRRHGFADGQARRIEASRKGFEELERYIEAEQARTQATSVRVGLESTGHYWDTVAEFLRLRGYEVVLVNPSHSKLMKEVHDNSPEKSDPKDAAVIAELVLAGRYLEQAPCTGVYAELRSTALMWRRRSVEKTSCVNRIHRLLDRFFPELLALLPSVSSKTTLGLLAKAVTPGDFLSLGKTRLTNLLRKVSRGQRSGACAEAILAVAERSVGILNAEHSRRLELREELAQIERIQNQMEELDKHAEELLKGVPYAGNLLSIRGVGRVTLTAILGEAGDLRQYRDAKALLKMAGLNLYRWASGKKDKSPPRISKRGRSLLRHTTFLAILGMVTKRGVFRPYYTRLTQQNGMVRLKAIVATMRKLLAVMFALVRDNTKFMESERDLAGPVAASAGA